MKPHTQIDSGKQARDGSQLNWIVVNPEGKLLAVLDSESEAHWFTRNRGHASGAVYFQTPCDYAAAPDLLAACEYLENAMADASRIYGNEIPATAGMVTAWKLARAAILRAKGQE